MQLPLYLKLTSKASMVTLALTVLSLPSLANDSDIAIRAGVGFYNGVDNAGSISEELSNNFVIGAQLPIKDNWSASIDGFFFDRSENSSYFGTTVNYTTEVSDDYDIYAKLGADFINGEAVPKVGLGIESELNNNFGLTMETVVRDTDRFAEYQFFIGANYYFFKSSVTDESSADDLLVEDSLKKDQILDATIKDDSQLDEYSARSQENKTSEVLKGDTLWEISKLFGVKLQNLIDLNKNVIRDPDLIYPDTILKIRK